MIPEHCIAAVVASPRGDRRARLEGNPTVTRPTHSSHVRAARRPPRCPQALHCCWHCRLRLRLPAQVARRCHHCGCYYCCCCCGVQQPGDVLAAPQSMILLLPLHSIAAAPGIQSPARRFSPPRPPCNAVLLCIHFRCARRQASRPSANPGWATPCSQLRRPRADRGCVRPRLSSCTCLRCDIRSPHSCNSTAKCIGGPRMRSGQAHAPAKKGWGRW